MLRASGRISAGYACVVATEPRTCTSCRRELTDADFATPLRKVCKGCELYKVTLSNTRGRGAPLEMTRGEVLAVFGSATDRRCFYCGIAEADYVGLLIPTPSGRPGLRLGLDRVDSHESYTSGNVVVCCLVCNRLKSSTFTHAEMVELGRAVNSILRARGLDATLP